MNEKNTPAKQTERDHRISIDNRKKLIITGVTDTDKFDESSVLLYSCMGEIIVKGRDLHVSGLSVESGEMVVEGEINAVIYGDSQVKGPLGFLGKLTK